RHRKLALRLQAFGYSLMIAVPLFVTLSITYLVAVRVRNPQFALSRGEQVDAAWFVSVSEAQEATSSVIIGAMFILAMLAVQLLGVLSKLRQFVVTHEIDLVARDQIAMHQATKPGDTEGIPVGTVPAPN
ncbi:MAG: hypothetical protein ACI9S9_001477, partial [Planctomycetota bacterium]